MSAQHTPGRLIVRNGYSLYAADGKTPVADTCLTNSVPDNDEANARRLVACWNACEGISTDALERLGTLDRARVDLDVIRTQASPQQQMIAALEAILDEVSGFRKPFDGDSHLPLHLIAQAMDALEAAKGVQA